MFWKWPNINTFFSYFVMVLTATALDFTTAKPINQTLEVERYLRQFGYLPGSHDTSSSISPDVWQQAIKDFQEFNGLNKTGLLDSQTLRSMSARRCGVRDKKPPDAHLEYSLLKSSWPVKNITYRVSKYTKQLPKKDVDKEIRKAFAIWSEYTDLTFTPILSEKANIDIRFDKCEHGDFDPFDGPANVLGHANAPGPKTHIHLDDSENWTVDSFCGVNLLGVLTHEIGHALGLNHSSIKPAVMAPFYQKYKPDLRLHTDDIRGIQALYGNRTKQNPVSGDFKCPGKESDNCTDSTFEDSGGYSSDNSTFNDGNGWFNEENGGFSGENGDIAIIIIIIQTYD